MFRQGPQSQHRKSRFQDRLRKTLVLLGAWLLVAVLPAHASEPVEHLEGVPPLPPLDDAYLRLSQAYEARDVEAAAAVYEADALFLQPDETIRRGRGAIGNALEDLFGWAANKGYELHLSFTILEREICGDFAYDVGYYELARSKHGIEHGSSRVKFVLVAHAGDDGVWRFAVDAFSRAPKR